MKLSKYLLVIPIFFVTLIITFFILLSVPDSLWGCQGFGCFGASFAIPYYSLLIAAPLSLILSYLFVGNENNFNHWRTRLETLISQPLPKKRLILLLLLLPIVPLLLLVTSLIIPKREVDKTPLSRVLIPTSKPTISVSQIQNQIDSSNWTTYTDPDLKLLFRYPALVKNYPQDFYVTKHGSKVNIVARPLLCRLRGSSDNYELMNGLTIELARHKGNSFAQIWENAFGSVFQPENYDGGEKIAGYNAYYFYQGAEMQFGRKAILVNLSPSSALEINIYTPIYDFECQNGSLNMFSGYDHLILSTFEIIDISPKIYSNEYYSFEYPGYWSISTSPTESGFPEFLASSCGSGGMHIAIINSSSLDQVITDDPYYKGFPETTTLDDQPARYFVYLGDPGSATPFAKMIALFPSQDKIVALRFYESCNLTLNEAIEKEFTQILSTFKFLE